MAATRTGDMPGRGHGDREAQQGLLGVVSRDSRVLRGWAGSRGECLVLLGGSGVGWGGVGGMDRSVTPGRPRALAFTSGWGQGPLECLQQKQEMI